MQIENQQHKQFAGSFDVIILAVMLAVGLAIRLVLLYSVPISAAPDEGAHQWVIQFIHEHARLPGPADADGPSYYEALPPFGYIPHVLTTTLIPTPFLTLSARFGGLLSFCVLIVFGYLCSKTLFPRQRLLMLVLPTVLVLHPQLCFIQAYANSDATVTALASVALYLVLRILKIGANMKSSVALGIVLAWLLLSKYTGSSVAPILVFALIPAAILHKDGIAKGLKTLGIAAGIPILFCGAWFARTNRVFGGDTFGTNLMIARWVELFHPPLTPLYKFPVVTHIQWRREAFMSFWGLFGNLNRPLPQVFYLSLELLTEIAVIAWILFAVRYLIYIFRVRPTTPSQLVAYPVEHSFVPERETWTEVAIWSIIWLCALAGLAALVASALSPATSMTPPQARYLFPAEIPCIALILKGYSLYNRKAGNILACAMAVVIGGACTVMLLMLPPLYGFNINPMR